MAQGAQGPGAKDFRPVKSAYRALDVLESMAAGPATMSELSRRLDIPKSSLHGLLRTLSDRGWVEPIDGGTRFRLGLRALQVGARYIAEDEVVARVAPVLDRLAAETDETVQQARLDGDEVVYLAKRDSTHPVRLMSSIGSRLPAHATALGKALLAGRDEDTLHDLLTSPLRALTKRTITTWGPLHDELRATRERGYAVDDGETADGLRCFAVTVPAGDRRDGSVPPTDAISVSVPLFRLDEEREKGIVTALLEARAGLQGVLPPPYGGRGQGL